jgi:hypothetical protein
MPDEIGFPIEIPAIHEVSEWKPTIMQFPLPSFAIQTLFSL